MIRNLVLALGLIVVVAGCSGSTSSPARGSGSAVPASEPGPEILPLLVSSEITKGENRFLFSLTDRSNALIAARDVKVHLKFYDVAAAKDTVVFETDATFMWAVKDQRGLYRADVTFPRAGRWGTRFEATLRNGQLKTVRADYDVAEAGTTPAIGALVTSVETPTAADVGGDLRQLTSDKTPDPRFYETSIAQALAARTPFVVVFATPAFCQTQLCGPTLEVVKGVAQVRRDLTFINVEPYRMTYADGRLQPELDAKGQLQTAAWTEAWGLPSEPFTFVVGAEGRLKAKFEGVLDHEELEAVLEQL